MLRALPHLHTIQVHHCKVAGEFARALGKTTLPSVRVLVLPDGASPLVRACPNATHVRCTGGGKGTNLVIALKDCECEVFGGLVNWTAASPNIMQREWHLSHTLPSLTLIVT